MTARFTRTAALAAVPFAIALLAGCSAADPGTSVGGAPSAGASSSSAASTKALSTASNWYAKKYGTFAVKTYSGKGDDVLKLPAGAKAGKIAGRFKGEGNFIVSLLDSGNQQTAESGFNQIGNFHGSTAFGLQPVGNAATTLKVQAAGGSWTLTVSPISALNKLPTSGSGDGVYRYDGPSKTAKITHKGSANFIVNEYSDATLSNLQINEIGNYSGKSLVDAGPAVVEIQADGSWTVK